MSKNEVIVLPISTYSSLNRDLFSILQKKEFNLEKGTVELEVPSRYKALFKIIQSDSDKNNQERNSVKRNYNYRNLFKVLEQSELPPAMDVLTKATGELQYFKYKDQPVMPTKEFISMVLNLKKEHKVIEMNSGIGQIGEITGIESYDPKVFEPHKKELFQLLKDYKIFPEIKITGKKYKTLYVDFLNEDDAKKFAGDKYKHVKREHTMYFELSPNVINKQVLIDLHNIGAIQEIDGVFCIFMNDIEPYLETFSTTEAVYKKQLESESGVVDLTKVSYLLNRSLRIYYDGYSDHSLKQQILFAMSFLNFNKMCAEIAEGQNFMAKDLERNDIVKFTTYEEFVPKTIAEFKNYKEFVVEQDTNYYVVKLDDLRKSTRTESEFEDLLAGILINSVSLKKEGLYYLFKYNVYLQNFVDDLEDPSEMSEYDYEWLSVQYSNISRLLIIYLKQQNRFVFKDAYRVKTEDLLLSHHDEKLFINYNFGFTNSLDYPERIKKAKYSDVPKLGFERNEQGIIISYNPSDTFSPKKVFEYSKKLTLFVVCRIEALNRMNFYKSFHYAIINTDSPFIVSPYSSITEPEKDVILLIKHRKNKFSFESFARKHNLKILSSNC